MAAPPTGASTKDTDQLHQLGYAQELRRGMKTFSNFAVSFTIISILSGCLTLFLFAMNTGGPAVMTLGWLVVGFFVILVALGMAEVASSYPTAGGLYYWAAKLAPESGRDPAKWSWFVGWFNLVGQVAVTAGIDFGLAVFATALLNLTIGYPVSPQSTIAVYAVVLVLHALLNTFGIRLVALLNDVSVWWHVVGVAVIVIVCVFLNQHTRTDLGTVFSKTVNNTGFSSDMGLGLVVLGIPLYVALIGLLNAQYTLTGYDASAHMSEETHGADTAAPRGIVFSVVISVIFGFILLVAMNVGITPEKIFPAADGTLVDGYQNALTSPTGVPPAQIWIDAIGQSGGIFVLFLVVGAQFFCGMSSVTANSRMIYAFSRDGAVPGSSFWHRINKRTRTPTNSIWLAAVGRVHPRPAVPVQPGRVRGHHVDRGHRPVRRLHLAGVPAPHGGQEVPGRPVDARPLEPADRYRGHDLGGDRVRPVHAPAGVPDHDPELELHADRVPGRPRWRSDLVLHFGQELVQGPQGAGLARGAGRDRARPRATGLIRPASSHTRARRPRLRAR